MDDYTSPGEAISKGLIQGMNLASNFAQISQQRQQQQWERQLKVAEIGMKLVENKNLPEAQRIAAFNQGARPVLARLGMPMPELTPKMLNSDSFQEAVTKNNALIEQMQDAKKPLDPWVGFKGITQNFTGALATMDAETEPQKIQRELITHNAQMYVDAAEKAKAHGADKTPTPADAIKRNTELNMQLAKLNTSNLESQIMADAMNKAYPGRNFEPGKISAEDVELVKTAARREISYNNTLIPNDRFRHKFAQLTPEEAAKMKEAGVPLDEIHNDYSIQGIPAGAAAARTKPATPGFERPRTAPMPTRLSIAPPPLAAQSPMAGPAQVVAPPPTAGPLSLSGGAVQSTQTGPLQLQNQSLQ